MADDKVRELAEKLFANMDDRRGFHTDDLDEDVLAEWKSDWERILRAELKPLLDAAQGIQEWGFKNLDIEDGDVPYFYDKYSPEARTAIDRLAAELAHWRKDV